LALISPDEHYITRINHKSTDITTIVQYILGTSAGVKNTEDFGCTFYFYRPERMPPFATIANTGNLYETALDVITPHPDYAGQNWVCVLNPSEETFDKVQAFLAEVYDIASRKDARRRPKS
jgi:hypothetical protein